MFIQILFLTLLCLFYIIYFAKAIILKKQGISVDLLGKGDKPKKAARVELILKAVTWCGAVIKFISVIFPNLIRTIDVPFFVRIAGAVISSVGVIFFAVSISIMRSNWRAGFDKKQNTSLVTNGIYKISRNPAFVGFDLLYIGCTLAFTNIVMIAVALIALMAFHVQILGEEHFLTEKFGQEYTEYKSKVRRYL